MREFFLIHSYRFGETTLRHAQGAVVEAELGDNFSRAYLFQFSTKHACNTSLWRRVQGYNKKKTSRKVKKKVLVQATTPRFTRLSHYLYIVTVPRNALEIGFFFLFL